jgi:hypothetical protein
MCHRGEWQIIEDVAALNRFYADHGVHIKSTWRQDGTGFAVDPDRGALRPRLTAAGAGEARRTMDAADVAALVASGRPFIKG